MGPVTIIVQFWLFPYGEGKFGLTMQPPSVSWQGPDCNCHPGGGGTGVGNEVGIDVGGVGVAVGDGVGASVGGAGVGAGVGGTTHGSEPASGQIFHPRRC